MNWEILAHILIWTGFIISVRVSEGRNSFKSKVVFWLLVTIVITCEIIAIPMMIYYLFK